MSERRALPERRIAEVLRIRLEQDNRKIPSGSYHIGCGYYPDGTLGEIFINSPKVGTGIDAANKASAVLVSIALQYGLPLDVLASALPKEEDGSQSTLIGIVLETIMARGLMRYGGKS